MLEGVESHKVKFSTETFVGMKQLRFLQLNNIEITEGHGKIFQNLKWLRWHKFPLDFIPDYFHLEKLVSLDLQYSNLQQVWRVDRVSFFLYLPVIYFLFHISSRNLFIQSAYLLFFCNCSSLDN